MRITYTLLLLIVFLSNTLYSQEEVDTVKALDFIKKLYSDTAYLSQFFEKDITASKFLSNEITEVKWNKTYTEQDLEKITEQIKANINFDIGKEKEAILIQDDTIKAYQHIFVSFSLPEGIDKEFIEVYFEPTKILIANQSVGLYPKDRGTKFNESGFFGHDGQYIQRIPISILKSEEISGKIKVEGILKVALASRMIQVELEQNKQITTVQNKTYELLGIQNGKGYLKGSATKIESFKDKDYKLCMNEEGMRNCGLSFTIPYSCFQYLSRGLQHFDSLEYSKILDSITYSNFQKEDKVILINSRNDFDKIVLFYPDNTLSVEENINKSSLDFGEEIELKFLRASQWDNTDPIYCTFEVMGLINRPNNYIKIKEITNAIDNTGKVLEEEKPIFPRRYRQRDEISFRLEAPDTTATYVSIQGVLKYCHPTIENKGKIQIQVPLNKTNTNLLASTHKEMELYLLAYEGLQDLIVQKEEERSQLVQQQEQLTKIEFTSENRAELYAKSKQLKEDISVLQEMIVYIKYPFEDSDIPKEDKLALYFYDPDKKTVDIIVYDEKNEKMNRPNRAWATTDRGSISIELESKSTSTLILELLIENEASCKEFPFQVKGIKLPMPEK